MVYTFKKEKKRAQRKEYPTSNSTTAHDWGQRGGQRGGQADQGYSAGCRTQISILQILGSLYPATLPPWPNSEEAAGPGGIQLEPGLAWQELVSKKKLKEE